MPYSLSNPPSVAKSLPKGALAIFIAAFNAAMKQKGTSEQSAFKIAWAAVKKKYKKVGEKWVAKGGDSEPPEFSEAELEELIEQLTPEPAEAVDVQMDERFSYADAAANGVRITNDGYLVAQPRIARTGIQIYKGWEVGAEDMDEVRVYRPEAEVFAKDALTSLAWKPVTLDHPSADVNSENWRDLSVGQIAGEVARDGEFVRVPLVLMDQYAIDAWRDGKAQLSVGYSAKLIFGEGQTPDGKTYDAMQTAIRANHVAVVNAARGGPLLRIGDRNRQQQRRTHMPADNLRTLTIDGVSISLEDKDSQILQRHLDALRQSTADVQKKLDDANNAINSLTAKVTEITKQVETKDGEIAALNKKLQDAEITPAKLDKYVSDRLDVVERARNVLGDKALIDGKTDTQIKRDVVAELMGGETAKAMSDDAITGAFNALTQSGGGSHHVRRTADSFRGVAHNSQDAAAKAYDKRNADLQNAWKQQPKAS